jgi:AbrB family transcriptional regulator, stage V sporulation protein T
MTAASAYHLKLQAQGRVVVPADVRADLGVQEGDELILLKEAHGYRLTSRRQVVLELAGSLQKTGAAVDRDLTQELLDDRREEARKKGW